MRTKLLITTLLTLFTVCQVIAQEAPYYHGLLSPTRGSFIKNAQVNALNGDPTVNNSTGYSGTGANLDVIFQRINWTVDPRAASNTITGNVLFRFKTIAANVSTITFDLNSTSFNNGSLVVTYHGSTIAGRTLSANILSIPLPATIVASGTIDSVTVAYSGVPPTAVGAAQGYQRTGTAPNQYTTSLSESYEDRDWWPCKADMQDKIDSLDINVTVPWNNNVNGDTFWVATNGVLYDSTINGPALTRTFKFKTRYPIASYLVTLSVGKFTRYHRSIDINGTIVPVAYYILRNSSNHATKVAALDKINPVVDSFSRRWGDYPFKLEKHGFYDGLLGAGGMEHQTFSAMSVASMGSLGTLNHELAHQWFGDNVTFATWNELWLAEGPARFSEIYAAEKVPGLGYSTSSVQTLKTNLKNSALALNSQSAWIPNSSMGTSALIWSTNYGSTVYERGGMIITMLRTMCGDTKFDEAMRNYQIALAGKSATSDSLKNHFNAVLKADISGFFNAYVGGSGGTPAPGNGGLGNNVDTIFWNSPATNKLVLQVGVQTKTNASNTNYFQGPVVVRATAVGKDTTIIFYDWGSGNLSYAGNGISAPFAGNALNYDLSFTPTALIYDDSARTLSTGGTRNVSAFKGYVWKGTTSSAWNTASNWETGVVPPAGAQITIATTGSNPVLPGNTTVGKLYLNAGTRLTIGANTLTINHVIVGTGTITGSAASSIIINNATGTLNMDQTSAATRSLNNLTLGLGASAKLGNAMDVFGTITLSSASLDLNGVNLTLKSNAAGTARIADLTNCTITGATNVTMERYIKLRTPGTGDGTGNNGRAYRLLTPGVNTTGSIRTNWMEGGLNTVIGTNVNPVPGYGTQITGLAGNTNGFDVTATNAPSLYNITNAVTPTYTAITSTSGTLNALRGYFLYIRGDRSMNMQVPLGTNMPTSHTTLRTTGSLVTGTQSSFSNAYVGGGALNLVTNPYPSPIDWSLVKAASTNITNFYTLWDPNIGTRGGFVTVNTAGTPSAGTANQFIQSGQAFFVQASGGVPVVNIQESHKSAGNNNTVFLVPPPPEESFLVGLYFNEDSGYRRQSDGIRVVYNNAYSAAVDDNDATEINNWDENIAVNRQNTHLAVESRPVIMTKDTIALFMNNMKQRDYEFDFIPVLFTNIGLKAELVDNYLNTRTLLSVVDTVTVGFTVTADPASSAADRFMVVFGPASPLAIDVLTISAQAKYLPAAQGGNHIQVDWSARTEKDMDRYELERSFDGATFTRIHQVAAVGNSTVPVQYSWMDANAQTGYNYYRIKAIDKTGLIKYTTVVKVDFGKTTPAVSVYPNPVTDNSFAVQLRDVEKGSYMLTLVNNLGQTMYQVKLQHRGGNANIQVNAGKLAGGLYKILLTGENSRFNAQLIKH